MNYQHSILFADIHKCCPLQTVHTVSIGRIIFPQFLGGQVFPTLDIWNRPDKFCLNIKNVTPYLFQMQHNVMYYLYFLFCSELNLAFLRSRHPTEVKATCRNLCNGLLN